jgi:alcohol dehydrogenase
VSDASAVHGLRLLADALPRVAGDRPGSEAATDRAVVGALLVQLDRRISVIHAFGHGFARRYPVQQGAVHAIVVPHVLRYVLGNSDARAGLLAEGLGVDAAGRSDEEVAEGILERVVAVRDSLELPSRLRELDPVSQAGFPAIARFILEDGPMGNAPAGLDATVDDIAAVRSELDDDEAVIEHFVEREELSPALGEFKAREETRMNVAGVLVYLDRRGEASG